MLPLLLLLLLLFYGFCDFAVLRAYRLAVLRFALRGLVYGVWCGEKECRYRWPPADFHRSQATPRRHTALNIDNSTPKHGALPKMYSPSQVTISFMPVGLARETAFNHLAQEFTRARPPPVSKFDFRFRIFRGPGQGWPSVAAGLVWWCMV